MAEGADVTIKYSFLPTETSIREGVERVTKQFNRVGGSSFSNASAKKIKTESDKTVDLLVNFLRMTQQKTSLQTKLMAGMKLGKEFFGLGGEKAPKSAEEMYPAGSTIMGGAKEAAAGAGGGGMMGALGSIVGLLTVISVAMMLIGAFFEAVGPIIKVVVKMIGAMILILLMPFLKRGLPILFGILKAMIDFSKTISNFVDAFLTYIEGAVGELAAGNPMGLIKLWLGPIGMVAIELLKILVQFLSKVDWNQVILTVLSALENVFVIIKDAVKGLVIAFFGEDTWNLIKNAIKFVQSCLAPTGLWEKIKAVINDIGENVFGKGIWDTMKNIFYDIIDTIALINAKFVETWNSVMGVFGKTIEYSESQRLALAMAAGYIKRMPTKNSSSSGSETTTDNNVASTGASYRFNPITQTTNNPNVVHDFISRPGIGVQPFSPSDTIIGTKGGLGGVTINNTLNVSAGVDKNEFRKILSDFNREQARELRMRTNYSAGIFA